MSSSGGGIDREKKGVTKKEGKSKRRLRVDKIQ